MTGSEGRGKRGGRDRKSGFFPCAPPLSSRILRRGLVVTCVESLVWGLLFTPPVAHAATYYVSATEGHDAHPGTLEEPCATIQHAADRVLPGDTVIVREGTYTKAGAATDYVVRVDRGGTASAWVTFKSERPWGARVDGQDFTVLGGWRLAASYVCAPGRV